MKTALQTAVLTAAIAATTVHAEEQKLDNGTDPTKVSSSFISTYEHLDLINGFNSNVLKLKYKTSIASMEGASLMFTVPIASLDMLDNDGYALGDASVQFGKVFGLDQKGGHVLQAELVFDTADRQELGTGKNVLKATYIRAFFRENGAIFAPALVHSIGLWGDDTRAEVNTTTLDLYYVPKMANPKNLLTFDPSINVDWENSKEFLGLAVTYGRVIGPAFGGNAIVTVKPSAFAGNERPSKWGFEVGYKVIGF